MSYNLAKTSYISNRLKKLEFTSTVSSVTISTCHDKGAVLVALSTSTALFIFDVVYFHYNRGVFSVNRLGDTSDYITYSYSYDDNALTINCTIANSFGWCLTVN